MKVLVICDVQRSIIEDSRSDCIDTYNKCVDYANHAKENGYDKVIAGISLDMKTGDKVDKMLKWEDNSDLCKLEFSPDLVYVHSGYLVDCVGNVDEFDTIDIIGFNSDTIITSTCFAMFEEAFDGRIIPNLMNSTNGTDFHFAALKILARHFDMVVR